jgi:AraC-like DNA-binding protein
LARANDAPLACTERSWACSKLPRCRSAAEAALRAQPAVQRFDESVAAKIRAGLPQATSIDAIADLLRMSPCTLQRRLGELGTQFSDILDGVRADEARTALTTTGLPLAEIAWRLGYADLAAFSRAFKRWTGQSPGQFRATRRSGIEGRGT